MAKEALGASEPTQEHLVALREIYDAIELLPPQQRRVMQGILEDKSEFRLAEELNVSEATVRSLRRFGRIRLAAILEKGGHLK